MKLLFLMLFFLLFQSASFSQNQWQYINDNSPYIQVYSTDVVDSTAYFWGSNNIVFKTSDAGESFQIFLPYAPTGNTALGTLDNHGISFATKNIGYIADPAHGEFITHNGGETWFRTGIAYSNISLIEFGSASVGWKIGGAGFYKTTNAGDTWNYISLISLFDGGVFSNIYSLDENRVWILKSYYQGRNVEGSIWYSSDGGESWQKQQTGTVSSEENQFVYTDIKITKSGIGIAIGEINRPALNEKKAFIQRTTNFGETWSTTELAYKKVKNIIPISDSVWVILANTKLFIDDSNEIVQLRSTNDGQTWTESTPFQHSNYIYLHSTVYIPPYNTILVNTVAGIYKSTDKGQTYALINSKLGLYVTDVNLDRKPISQSEQVIIASSFNRSYLISENSGLTWEKKEIPAELGYKIWEVKISENAIYIIVDQLHLYKSNDFGESWVAINVPAYSALRGLDVVDKNTLVVSSYSALLISKDGGESWKSTPFPGDFFGNFSFMFNQDNIVTVGGFYKSFSIKGFIYKTSDLGYNWQITDTPSEMKQIKMITNNVGYACSESNLYKTLDAGNTWRSVLSANNKSISAFYFSDALNGIVHRGIYFYQTNSGGTSWIRVNIKFPYESADKIEKNSLGDFFIVSYGNLLFSRSGTPPKNTLPINKEKTDNKIMLFQNSPNPFNPTTNISFSINENGFVKLNVYNILGELVDELVNEYLVKGKYTYQFNANNLSSGVFFYAISVNGFSKVKKMNYLK